MALQIVKNPAALPKMREIYGRYASVSTVRRTGLGKFFGPSAGAVYVSLYSDRDRPMYQILPPKWKKGQGDEWENLGRCYRETLRLAEKDSCKAVTIPLLTEKEPDFPASIDYKIAVDTIREFLKTSTMEVFLLISRPEATGMPELRRDLESFLSVRFPQERPLWSAQPFQVTDDRFATLTPLPCQAAEELVFDPEEPPEADYEECCDWDDTVMSRKYSCAGRSVFGADVREQNTGSLPEIPALTRMLDNMDAGFSETLLKLIDQTGKKDSEIYSKANVSRQHFSKIRNNPDYKPTKATALAFAIALELDLEQTGDLIGRAGYALTSSSKFDVIITYFIQQRNYNMFDINDVLFEYDQSLLGA